MYIEIIYIKIILDFTFDNVAIFSNIIPISVSSIRTNFFNQAKRDIIKTYNINYLPFGAFHNSVI